MIRGPTTVSARLDSALLELAMQEAGVPLEEEPEIIRRGRKLAESGDPMAAMEEILGYPTTPDIERAIEKLEANPKVLAVGCHDGGKTFWLGGYMLIWRWFCQGCLPGDDGRPQGGVLALVSPKESTTLVTSWKAIRGHGARAAARGWDLPGYDPESSGASVIWRAKGLEQTWFITAVSFKAPAMVAKSEVISAGSGLKHPTNLTVWGEEIDEIPRPWHRTIEGWGPECILFAYNPYSASGPAYDLAQGDEWAVATFSYLRVPQVLNRRIDTPGLADHLTLEREIKHHCKRMGAYPETMPDEKRHDFVYALPTCPEEDWAGPRADGFPGANNCPLAVFRPSIAVDAGRLGQFPVSSESKVFSGVAWAAAIELGEEFPEPSYPPDVVGVDTAEGGPDRFVAMPRWGPSAADIWRRYQTALKEELVERPPTPQRIATRMVPRSPASALAAALKCQRCLGEGCDRCRDGSVIIRYGEPREIQKTDSVDEMAARIIAPWGTVPEYRLDAAAGGHWIRPAIERLRATAVCISFGGGPGDELPGQRLYLNQRAAMCGKIAETLSLQGAVALPAHSDLNRQAQILEWQMEARADGETAGGKLTRYKLPDKLGMKGLLGGMSPDHLDALFLTEGEPKRPPRGGSEMHPGL